MRLVLVFLALMAGCANSTQWPASGVYSGYYTYGFEVSRFMPAGTKEKWWLTGDVPCRPQYTKETVAGLINTTPILYVEVRGTLSAKGSYGHQDAYSRELKAENFSVCRTLLPNEHPEF
jgi:hypothetical protein